MKKFAGCITGISLSIAAYAAGTVSFSSPNQLEGFQAAIVLASHQTDAPVIFPETIPSPDKGVTYYVSADTATPDNSAYNIYIDASADCKGASYCNILTFNAKRAGMLPPATNMQGQVMTEQVFLSDGTSADYTQGYAKGDYWNPSIAWAGNGKDDKDILYTITWKGVKSNQMTRSDLIWMASNVQYFPFLTQFNS